MLSVHVRKHQGHEDLTCTSETVVWSQWSLERGVSGDWV